MRKILRWFGLLTLIVGAAFINFIVNFASMKQQYTSELNAQINIYLQQQAEMLARLGNTLLPIIEQQNYQQIAVLLSLYEDISYAPTHQGSVVPFNIQFVSLNAPQQIIGGFGALGNEHLVPEPEFYSKVVDTPTRLALSKIYYKPEMPNYPMLNLGWGIVGANDRFYGQLDLKLALINLRQYLLYRMHNYSEYFDFEFNAQEFTQPKVFMLKVKFWSLLLQYVLCYIFIITVCLGLARFIYLLWLKNKQHKKNLLELTQANTRLKEQLSLAHTAQAIQFAYGELRDRSLIQPDSIVLQKLLSDVLAVNAELAQQHMVRIEMPMQQNANLRIGGNKLILMQILSGMLHEIILQMKSAGTIRVHVNLTQCTNKTQQVNFIFSDDGYYDKLIDHPAMHSWADVRCKGWGHIQQLVAEYAGKLEYSHTAYTGNTICLTVNNVVKSNVVSLEAYLQD